MSFITLFFVVCPAAFWEIHLGEGRYKHPLHRTAILAFPFFIFLLSFCNPQLVLICFSLYIGYMHLCHCNDQVFTVQPHSNIRYVVPSLLVALFFSFLPLSSSTINNKTSLLYPVVCFFFVGLETVDDALVDDEQQAAASLCRNFDSILTVLNRQLYSYFVVDSIVTLSSPCNQVREKPNHRSF